MAVDERKRKQLHDALEQAIGPQEAATMMELVPQGGLSELATRRDIEHLEARMDAKLEGLEGRTEAKVEASARKVIMWTSSMVIASAGLAFTAGSLI